MLSKATNGTISSLYDKYPCFRDGSYVLYEFGLMFGNERAKLAATNLKNLVLACEGMSSFEHISGETSDALKMINVINFIERSTRRHQGGIGKRNMGSIVQIKKDVAQSDIMPALKTKVLESPRIVIFMDGDKVQGIFLVGDTVYTEVKKEGGVLAAVIKLIAMYYIFDMEFPKAYAMVMAVFQTIVLQEVYKRETSAKYKHFMKDLKFQLAEVAHREGQEESEK
ncbi:uncharacterized protein LOC125377026 [Haliotis rufescens]|uniref:uncharacterized protein LOC125377026 n=1 Tax=Haliotis rufescens TaxID=6454 RepID=UPI00201F361B|nr:uncharacterized protein LOC125377026 [Haliotis rufescens]